ncbi:hypothetical protein GCM10022423_08850 [Flavobacterium ginsengiterrae]|uniref:PA14 domain-containing protein n=2 Tax=Flavobacterium ginsengiterrae TaxID=871695 RepID=A0ABP7GBM6_9FLAO
MCFGMFLVSNLGFSQILQRGSSTTSSTATSTLVINRPSTVLEGDILIVNIAQVGNGTLTAPTSSGWLTIDGANLGTNGGTTRRGTVLYKVATSSEPINYTFNVYSNITGAVGSIVAFYGVDTVTPIDATGSFNTVNNSTTAVTAGSLTTTINNAAVIMFGQTANSSPTWNDNSWRTGSPGSLTLAELYDNQEGAGIGGDVSVGAAWAIKTSAGNTGTGMATMSGGQRNGGLLIALKPKVAYKSQIISTNTGSTNWCPGETRNVTVTIKNVGTATWTDGPVGSGIPDINIGIKWNYKASNDSWSDYHIRTDAGNLAPGETRTYTFSLPAINVGGSNNGDLLDSGINNISFDVVNEAVSWFAWNINGVGPGNEAFTTTNQTILAPPANKTIASTSSTVCPGTGTTITVAASEIGVNYQLRNASNAIIGSPVAGTGGTINLPTGNLTNTTTFNVLAIGCSSVQMSTTPTVTVTPLATTSIGTYTFCIDNTNTITTASTNAGQYALINVVKGFTYTFSVGNVFGTNEYLTVLDASNDSAIISNNNANGTNITNWISTLSGQIKLVLSAGPNCSNNGTTGGTMSLNLVGVNNTQDNQLLSGTNTWIGHVYNTNGGPPATNAYNTSLINPSGLYGYVGYYTKPEIFGTDNFGGDTVCFSTLSDGVNRANIYTQGFGVRYRMRSTKTGCYMVTVRGDDGVRLFVDGVKVFDAFTDHVATTYGNVMVYLSGNSELVLDYYENGGVNEVSFDMVAFDNSTNTIVPASRMLCSGGTQLLDGSAYLYNGGTNSTISYQWQRSIDNANFTDITGATSEDYTPPALTPTSNTTYYYRRTISATASNASACVYYSNSAVVTTSPSGTPATPAAITGIATQCPSVTGQVYSVPIVTNAVVYNWSIPTGWNITAGAGTNSITVTTGVSGQGGTISVTAQNGYGTSTSRTLSVTVITNLSAVNVTGTTTQSFCVSGSGSLLTAGETGGGTITSRQWGKRSIPGGVITPIASATGSTYTPTGASLGAGTWYVVCTSTPTCGNPVISNESTITITPNLSTVSITPNGDQALCASNSGAQLTVGETGGGTITSRQWGKRSASGGVITPIASATGLTYTPTGAVLGVGNWYIVCTSTPTCGSAVISNEVRVVVSPDITASVSISASPAGAICAGTSVTFTATATNQGSSPTYQWYKGTNAIPSATTGTYTSNSLVNLDAISVVMFSNASPCLTGSPATSNTITMTVNPTPAAPTASVTSQPTCANNTGTITITNPAPAPGITYSIDGSTYTNNTGIFGGLAPTTYNVTVRNASGCISQATSVQVNTSVSKVWNGSADTKWSNPANWTPNGVPVQTDCVVIPNAPVNKPVIEGTSTNFYAHTLTVNNATTLTVNSDKILNMTNEITVNTGGSLIFNNNSSLVQTNKNAVNSGNITYIRETSVRRYDYTYWSSPLTLASNFTLFNMSPLTLADKYTSYDSDASWVIHFGGGLTMKPGEGYSVRGPQNFDIVTPSIQTASFIGVPANGDVPKTTVANKFNLLGNPYPSAINGIKLIGDTNIGTIYLWTHNTPPAGDGSGKYKYASSDYAAFNLSGGIKTGGDAVLPTGYIAAGQGFFAKPVTNSITFTNDMRVGSNNGNFYKTAKTENLERNRVWLNLSNAEGAFKQMLVGYIEGATNGQDLNYDAASFNGNSYIDFYSISETVKFSIQARALPFQDSDIIPLGYKSTIAGDFKISIDHVDGFFDNQNVYLEDKKTGIISDLKTADYTFKTEAGTFTDRFTLRYTNKTLGNDDFENVKDGLLISVKDKVIKVTSAKESIKEVSVFDITGKLIYNKKKVGSTELSIVNLQAGDQVLLVKVSLENNAEVNRKVIFK